MRSDDLQLLYKCLRCELDAADAVRPRDGARIDRIAADLWALVRNRAGMPGGRAALHLAGPSSSSASRLRQPRASAATSRSLGLS
jgi:hypothetical protein